MHDGMDFDGFNNLTLEKKNFFDSMHNANLIRMQLHFSYPQPHHAHLLNISSPSERFVQKEGGYIWLNCKSV